MQKKERWSLKTDSSAVNWLFTTKEVRQFGRWVFALQEYDFEVVTLEENEFGGQRSVKKPSS
ncbi:hypothetical protein DAPPUDRAFT_255061 [Daphnia pulex]|uniref:Uncharacterized protein n=1 Tax=Daphnia pulex TaxID=6669 RepID=E9H8H4_DAPPU|nr:hypothetical protein DAPPUDRAFT_255061 [Daphnia pulex]|eukprot:EFX71977.1 hypothetical protein DAPPUDRAFT_255061 [Daphnia pulex]